MRLRGIAVAVRGRSLSPRARAPLAGTASPKAQAVQITFTGKGGGRYLDHTRWLREDTRECYASLLADEDLRVQWRIAWTGTLAPGAKGYSLRRPARGNDSIAGSVDGSAVKDSCDAADEEPGWSGTTICKTALDLHANGGLAARAVGGGLQDHLPRPGVQEPRRARASSTSATTSSSPPCSSTRPPSTGSPPGRR